MPDRYRRGMAVLRLIQSSIGTILEIDQRTSTKPARDQARKHKVISVH